ncbi:hypothetical protein E1A91_D12G055400v1 [Gossypium mustelinum]|uniref:UBC core domain-containing protein n=3 Tax=Gossypium TaxID=3633 RepID=A0A0D2T0W3_GOSRA|nr:hypothetical protein B456_008G053900 [Gossypium raimondii]TYI49737.1 hypothetical protein E1A91_D12G055400v1 [Gossypium mustelinum]
MEKLVDIVHFLHLEIHEAFGAAGISGAPQDNNIMLWNAVIFGLMLMSIKFWCFGLKHQFFYVRLVDLFDFLFRRLLCSIYVDVIYLKFLSCFKIYFDYYVRLGNKVNNIDDYYFDYLWCEDYKYIKVIFSDCRETSASQPRVYEDWITRNVADVVCIVFFYYQDLLD